MDCLFNKHKQTHTRTPFELCGFCCKRQTNKIPRKTTSKRKNSIDNENECKHIVFYYYLISCVRLCGCGCECEKQKHNVHFCQLRDRFIALFWFRFQCVLIIFTPFCCFLLFCVLYKFGYCGFGARTRLWQKKSILEFHLRANSIRFDSLILYTNPFISFHS